MNALENFQRGFGKENALALGALMEWKFVYHKRKFLTTDLRRSQKLFEFFLNLIYFLTFERFPAIKIAATQFGPCTLA